MKLSKIASILNIEYSGVDLEVESLNTIKNASSKEMTFLDNPKYIYDLQYCKACAILIKKEFVHLLPNGVIALITDEPYLMLAQISEYFAKNLFERFGAEPEVGDNCSIMPNSYLGRDVVISDNVTIFAGSYIGDSVKIGKNTIIYPNVTIYRDCIIGENCIIHAGAVIGSDGFGFAHTRDGKHLKIHHFGNVIIENSVEIGANTTIDKAVFGSTIIKSGTKIDNLVQIGHNTVMGENCIIVSQTGISGSTVLGRNVIMGGQSATAGHLKIGDFAIVAARGGVSKSIDGKKTYSGFPLIEHKQWLRLQAKVARLLKEN